MREELTGLADGGKVMSSEEKKNTEKFLALTVPSKHSAGQYIPPATCIRQYFTAT